MSFKLFTDTLDSLIPALKSGDLDNCSDRLERELRKREETPFHAILDLSISNSPRSVSAHFGHFFERESARFKIAAAYTELNDFNINPNRWYCDTFAFDFDGGNQDYDWLADWRSEVAPGYEITGLEPLQSIFAGSDFHDLRSDDARTLCEILVVVKFQKFMQDGFSYMKCDFPLYVSAHDYDFIAKLQRNDGLEF